MADVDLERERLRASLKARLFGEDVRTPRVGRYRLGLPVGEGATGTVYRAEDPDLDRPVALKLLRVPTDEVAQRRLVAEAQALARLNHPHVVTVHEVGREQGQLFIAMEFVEGTDLVAWTKRHPPGSVDRFRRAFEQMCSAAEGLIAAHDAGVVHRDLKPSNILVETGGRLRLADFGLATSAEPPPGNRTRAELGVTGGGTLEASMTATGAFVGTPAYMAPEQFDGQTDPRSDQFSFCVTFFEVLYGCRPYDGGTITTLLAAYEQGRIVEPPRVNVPSWVYAVLRRGLQPEPTRRFEDMSALRDALLAGRSRARRRPWLIGGLAAVAALGSWAVATSGAVEPCALPLDSVEQAWGVERQHDVREALVSRGGDHGQQVADRVDEVLGAWSEQWTTDRARTCEALRSEPDDVAARDEQRCLSRSAMAVGELTRAFVDVEASEVRYGPETALAIVDQFRCDRPSPDFANAEANVELARAIARARALVQLHRPADAEAEARHAALEAERRGLLRVFADAAVLLAFIERQRDRDDASSSWAERGLAAAEEASDRVLQFEAWIELGTTAKERGELDRAAFSLRRARSALEKMGDDPARLQRLQWTEAAIAVLHGRYPEAMQRYREALRTWEGNPLVRAGILCDLGDIQETHGTLADASDSKRKCVEEFERAYGRDGPQLALPVAMLAQTMLRQGKIEDAVEHYERADALFRSSPGYLPTMHSGVVIMLGQALRDLGQLEEAKAQLRRGIAMADGLPGGEQNVSIARMTLAVTLFDTEQFEDAVVELERLIDAEPPGQPTTEVGGIVRLNLAEAYARSGNREQALHWLREAESIVSAHNQAGTAAHAEMLRVIADIWVLVGDYGLGIELAEQALKVTEMGTRQRGETQWVYAQALAGMGRHQQAQAAALTARAALAEVGPIGEVSLAELRRWEATQPWATPGAGE